MPKTKEQELIDKIKTLEEIGELEVAEKYKAELAKIQSKEKEEKKMPKASEEVIEEGLELPATEEEWATGGSKWITFPPNSKVGAQITLAIEMGIPGWETAGKSFKFPVTVTEEGSIDEGKEDKIVGGALPGKTWKTQEVYRAVAGEDPPMVKGKDGKKHPLIVPSAIAGKPAVGLWQLQEGHKGGDPNAEVVKYPKLIAILPAGTKVSGLGI